MRREFNIELANEIGTIKMNRGLGAFTYIYEYFTKKAGKMLKTFDSLKYKSIENTYKLNIFEKAFLNSITNIEIENGMIKVISNIDRNRVYSLFDQIKLEEEVGKFFKKTYRFPIKDNKFEMQNILLPEVLYIDGEEVWMESASGKRLFHAYTKSDNESLLFIYLICVKIFNNRMIHKYSDFNLSESVTSVPYNFSIDEDNWMFHINDSTLEVLIPDGNEYFLLGKEQIDYINRCFNNGIKTLNITTNRAKLATMNLSPLNVEKLLKGMKIFIDGEPLKLQNQIHSLHKLSIGEPIWNKISFNSVDDLKQLDIINYLIVRYYSLNRADELRYSLNELEVHASSLDEALSNIQILDTRVYEGTPIYITRTTFTHNKRRTHMIVDSRPTSLFESIYSLFDSVKFKLIGRA